MSGDTDTTTEVGIDGRLGWPISGAIGGAIGALAFGLLVWLVDPAVIETTIPGAYGLESTGLIGWAIQLVHGAVLGLLFAFVVTRQSILGVLRTSVETDALARTSLAARLAAAGFVFGLAVWAVLPVIVLPVIAGVIGTEQAAEFPGLAAEGLVGHLLFGTVLGIVFALTTDLSGRASKDVLEES
ncbi:hypothetical protein ACLI4Y_04385 [Natrialbaceae archaeon A-CW3]